MSSSSSTFATLRETLRQVRRRRSRLYLLYHGSLLLIGLLALLGALGLLSAWLQPPPVVVFLFSLLFIAGAVALGWWFHRSILRMWSDDRQLAHYVEENIPDLEQRLLTSLEFSEAEDDERRGVSAQFIERLWQDAQQHVTRQQEQVERVAYSRNAPVTSAFAAVLLLVTAGALLFSDAFRSGGGQILWPFAAIPERTTVPLVELDEPPQIEILVEPGDLSMQRGEALNIIARIVNADPGDVELRLRQDNVNWQGIDMRRDGGSAEEALYSHYIPSMQEELVYYVRFDDGEQRSREYSVSLYELPRVEQIDVAFHYPEYTGIENDEEIDGGDLVVPEGTEVALQVQFNKPVQSALLEFQNEEDSYENLSLQVDGERGEVRFTVHRDAVYRIAAVDFDRLESENPLDYYIRAIEDEPPELVLRSPGQDQDVMPLEEVVIEVDAHDDYGLSDFTLHYSVVGRDERAVDFLPEEQVRSVEASELIYLEDLGVQPGDFVSYYLTLADNNALRGPQEVISDIYFLQVTPTDARYREAGGGGQQGGQGGGGDEGSALVTLQKDIIAATWKLRNEVEQIPATQFSDDVQVLVESQQEAIQRARMSIDRLSERLDFADDSYSSAVANLQEAIEYMDDAVAELQLEQVGSALQPEQNALQYVLRAEADINSTDVSFERTAGGGGGGNADQRERQDLQELFEMEMGRNENRYATPERGGQGGQAQSEEASRLEELARRQEGLTRAQRNLSRRMEDMSEEQRRRELERLRREQEQLTADLDQLSRQMNRRQQAQAGSQSSQQSGQQSGDQQMQRALEQMREAAQADSPAQAAARSQRALESLREQQQQMEAEQQPSSVNQLAQNVAQRGEQLAREQRELQQSLQDLNRRQGLGQNRLEARSDEELRELVNRQQEQRGELEEIEQMLRAIGARAGNEEQNLLSQAQRANRTVRPIREQMQDSSRVLNNGMVNLAMDLERDIGEELARLGQTLQSMNPGRERRGGDEETASMQAARDASELREQIESLRQQAEAYQQDGDSLGQVSELRQQLSRSRELSEQLTERLEDQAADAREQQGAGGGGGELAQGQDRQRGGIPEYGEAAALGNARSIRSLITGRDLESFLQQPELLAEMGNTLAELEQALRSRAELEEIERRLYASSDDEVPEQYRQMVEAYYRALSDSGGSAETTQ